MIKLKEITQDVSYTAVVLTRKSHNILVELMKEYIPDNWKLYAHHTTITMGPYQGNKELIGKEFDITVNSYMVDDKVMAVGVYMPIETKNKHPHITIAVNIQGDGKPFLSNKLDWDNAIKLPNTKLTGKLIEVPRGDNRFADEY